MGNSYLAERGRFGFIIPNKFVRANYGEQLRQFLTERVTLERIVDFGDLPVFPDAVTYPMIILTRKQTADESSPQVTYTRLHTLRPTMLTADISDNETLISRSALTANQWSLAGAATQTILDKMKAIGTPLEQLVKGKLYRGILTGFNEAFVIDRRTRDRLIAEDPKSAELIKPFVVGKDVKRYSINYRNTYILLTKLVRPSNAIPPFSRTCNAIKNN